MARLAATALLLLLLSLLAVANCRVLEVEAEPETAVAFFDEQGQAEPFIPQETEVAEAIPSVPAVAVGEGEGILRLPSHRHHRPCRHGFLHRHFRWARHHGLSHRHGALPGPGDTSVIPPFLPEEPREAELDAVVAEPDPDSRPDTDGAEMEDAMKMKPPRGDGDGGEESEAVKAWKREMLRRFRGHGHGLRFHHRHHEQAMPVEREEGAGPGDMHLHHVKMFGEPAEQEQQGREEGAPGSMTVKLFRRRFHHHGDEEQQDETARKHYFRHHHDSHSDSEVDDEVEELARMLSKAIIRRSLSRGGIRHHHHHHRAEEGGVRKWFNSLFNLNRF